MAKAKIHQWVGQLRDVGKVLRWNSALVDKASWVLSRIQSVKKPLPLPLPSSKCPSSNATEASNSNTKSSDPQLGDPMIPSIETTKTAPPKNGFISRALYYRRFYVRR
ncbi:uncharacterized protein LOC120456850 isoform X2 [Drosophila santomea]|uniref:uncharacterized protein LOC120456850 isoform X2 n=1 Tax=Drosophila santomea TaxID=129105 RepID=UPI001952BFDF|nr:uncharacterized protein LOC120456850 isoform X2 [Drosophila santomea]